MPNPKYPCLACGENVSNATGKGGGIECTICKLWVHVKCSDLEDFEFTLIQKMVAKRGSHLWACVACSKAHMELKCEVDVLKKNLMEIQEQVSSNRARMDKISDKTDGLEERIAEVEKATDKSAIITEVCDLQVVENAEREARKDNIIIFQLAEPDENITIGQKRKEKDGEALSDVLNDIGVKVDLKDDIKFWVRTGEKSEKQDKPRPLLVGFRDNAKKSEVFTKARNLAKSQRFKNISIVNDLTKRQREEDEELKKIADQRNQEMNKEDQSNFEWKVLGPKGQRKLMRTRKEGAPGASRRGKRGRTEDQERMSPPARRRQSNI